MKKFTVAFLALTLLLAVLLCGCGKKKSEGGNTSSKVVVKGEVKTLELVTESVEEGFDWTAYVGESEVLSVEKKDNGNGTYSFTVTALKEGKTDINFIYKRPDDVDVTSVAKYTYEVTKDLKLVEINHEGTYFNKAQEQTE